MWEEFKKFALKGNVLDMAIGVIIGGAFSDIVNSLVADIITPIISLMTSGINFKDLGFPASNPIIMYGNFINSVLNFFVVAFSIFFMVKAINKLHKKKEEAPAAPKGPTSEELLVEIRDLLKAENSK